MKEYDIPGIYDIDTRDLTKKLRENGSMSGKIVYNNQDIPMQVLLNFNPQTSEGSNFRPVKNHFRQQIVNILTNRSSTSSSCFQS